MNVEETKAMRTSKQQFPVHILLDQKQLESVKYFLITDASSTREIESRIAMKKSGKQQ